MSGRATTPCTVLPHIALDVVDVVAGQVAGHEGQAGQSQTGEVVVVAELPGVLVLVAEVVDLHR